MKDSSNKVNQLVTTNKVPILLEKLICKINISRYSLDNYKIFNPESYTLLCRLGEASDGFSYLSKSSKIVLETG